MGILQINTLSNQNDIMWKIQILLGVRLQRGGGAAQQDLQGGQVQHCHCGVVPGIIASINLSKLPNGGVLNNFSSQSKPNPKKVKLLKLNHQNQLYPTDPPQILQSHHPTFHLFPLTVQMSPPLLLVPAAVHEGGDGGLMGWQHCQVGHGGAGGSCGAGF